MDRELLIRLNGERAQRRPALVATILETGASRLVTAGDVTANEADAALASEFSSRSRSGKSGLSADGEIFFTIHVPPPRLVVIGAVHIAEALVPMARIANFDVLVIDPRTAFAVDEKFPGAEVVGEWPEAALARRPLDAHTALAALTHDPKIDDQALKILLDSEVFYIGALGSRKTHANRKDRLRQMGFSDTRIARLYAPIGLDIGADNPEEIALAIMAEIVGVRRGVVQPSN